VENFANEAPKCVKNRLQPAAEGALPQNSAAQKGGSVAKTQVTAGNAKGKKYPNRVQRQKKQQVCYVPVPGAQGPKKTVEYTQPQSQHHSA
jgi:hypothetical protein